MNPEDVKREFDEAQKYANELKSKFAKATATLGQVSLVLETTKPYWVQLAAESADHIGSQPILCSGVASIHQMKNALMDFEAHAIFPTDKIYNIALSASTFGSNTAATGSLIALNDSTKFDARAIPTHEISEKNLANRFSKLDPALGLVCAQISESLYGTIADPERSALFMIRQTWDQLFAKLAPDAEVRASPFWTKKSSNKPDQVTREERIRFTIDRHVKDPVNKELLISTSKQMSDIYQELNRAHDRGELNRDKARQTLNAVHHWLFQLAEGIGI
jgi:Predicted pPIWI-associating nuclease